MTLRVLATIMVLCVCACGDDVPTGDAGSDTGGLDALVGNSPPVWEPIPTELRVSDGGQAQLPGTATDPDGDEITITVTSEGVEAEVVDSAVLVRADYGNVGGSITVTLSDGEASVEYPISVAVGSHGWTSPSASADLEAREHPAVIMDAARNRVLVIGGSGYDPYLEPLDDVWQFDLGTNTWSELTVSGAPSGGGSRRVVQLPTEATAYLYGGYGEGGRTLDELWRVDFSAVNPTFEQVEQNADFRLGRSLHAFFYDSERETFWAFGGITGSFPRDDVARMQIVDGVAQWELLELSAPSGRYGFFYGFDDVLDRLFVFSGAQATAEVDPAEDAWILDVSGESPIWSQVLMGETPPGRRNGAFAFDPTGPRLWVFGGTADAATTEPGLWLFDLRPGMERASERAMPGEPPIRSSGVGIFDPNAGQVLMGFGNTGTAVYSDLHAIQLLN